MRPFGRMLWEENARAIVTRNRDRAEGEQLAQSRRRLSLVALSRRDADRALRARALPRYQCDEDASFAQSNARAALCAIMGAAVAAARSMDVIKHAAHLPFGGFKESEIAAFLRRVELTGLASELSRE